MDEQTIQIIKLKKTLEMEKQEFLAVMSHELRTPMAGVKGYLSMVLDGDAGEISPEVREYIAAAYVANDRLIRLVDHLVKVAAAQDGRLKINMGEVDLVENLEVLTHDFQIPAKEKGLSLTYNKPTDKIMVKADPDRLREIFLNLISNAIKFTKTGSVTISHKSNENGWAVVNITDTGIGIGSEYQGRIFEIFSKANLALASQEKGTGVGLYLIKKLAEAQGAKVWLENSQEGIGSTFSAAFPLVNNNQV